MRGLARTLLALTAGLLVWIVARPAFASAPMCDPRAATTFAPAPILDAPSASVDLGVAGLGCGDRSAGVVDVHQGRPPASWPAPDNVDTVLSKVKLSVLAPRSGFAPRALLSVRARTGVRLGLERPPR